MSSGSLARRYAKALMSIGRDDGSFERIGRDVKNFAGAMKSSDELIVALTNPAFPQSDREKIVRAILQRLVASQTVVNFTRLLLERERMAILPDISRELDALISEQLGRVRATATSAQPLSADQTAELVTKLEALSGRSVDLEVHEDPDLLGGVVAKVGDIVYDGSLRTQLRELRTQLLD